MAEISRRDLLLAAATVIAVSGGGSACASTDRAGSLRGVAQRGRLPNSSGFGAAWTQGVRTRHVLPVPFRRIRLVLPTFNVRTLADVDFPHPAEFSAAIEYPYQPSLTELSPRRRLRFGEAGRDGPVGRYDPRSGPFPALVTEEFDLGEIVPAGTALGSWVSMELSAHRSLGRSVLPVSTVVGSSLFPSFEATVSGQSSLIDEDWCRAAANIDGTTLGPTEAYVPLIMVDCGPQTRSMLVLGDSIAFGVNEGIGGTGSLGDLRGDANGNRGWVDRWLMREHVCFTNFSRASQQLANMAEPEKTHRQRALAAMLDPTDLLIALGTNDIFKRGIPQMRRDLAAIVESFESSVGKRLPLSMATLLPKSASTDGWKAADKGQTAAEHFGPFSRAAEWNALLRNRALGNTSVTDVQGSIHAGSPDDFLWAGDGVHPDLYTVDGVHPTSDGYDRISSSLAPPW